MKSLKEISISVDGNLTINEQGDLSFSLDSKAVAEHILIRLKTYKNAASYMPGIGSILVDIIGEPNTKETGDLVKQFVQNSLSNDRFLSSSDYLVDVYPSSETEISIYIDIDPLSETNMDSILEFTLDLMDGNVIYAS